MSDTRPEPDKRPNEDGADVKRQVKKRIAIAGALVAVALAAIPILNSLNKNKVETTASIPQASSGRIITASEPISSISAPEASAPQAQASEPAHAAPGLPNAPATDKTPAVAATQTTPPTAANAPATKPATASSPTTPPTTTTAPPPATPVKQAKPSVSTPVATHAPAPAVTSTPAPAPAVAAVPAPLVPRATHAAKVPPPVQVEAVQPAEAPTVKGGSFGYNVQLGLFSSLDNALKLANALKAQGIPVKTETRVAVGPFRSRAEAEETMAKLKTLGYSPLLQAATQ